MDPTRKPSTDELVALAEDAARNAVAQRLAGGDSDGDEYRRLLELFRSQDKLIDKDRFKSIYRHVQGQPAARVTKSHPLPRSPSIRPQQLPRPDPVGAGAADSQQQQQQHQQHQQQPPQSQPGSATSPPVEGWSDVVQFVDNFPPPSTAYPTNNYGPYPQTQTGPMPYPSNGFHTSPGGPAPGSAGIPSAK
jgi:hypothetical protein